MRFAPAYQCAAATDCIDSVIEHVAHGWWKLNDDGSKTTIGAPPYLDIYEAVRSLDNQFPVAAEISAIFDAIARTVADLYPERVRTEMLTPYDARTVLFEFNDHPLTTQADVIRVLIATIQ
jgi:hypothetical protein